MIELSRLPANKNITISSDMIAVTQFLWSDKIVSDRNIIQLKFSRNYADDDFENTTAVIHDCIQQSHYTGIIMPWLLVYTSHTRLYSASTLHRDYYTLVKCALVPSIVIEVGWWTSVTHMMLYIPHGTLHMVLLMLPTF